MTYIIPCLASFLLTAVLTPQIIRLATACNCLDVPGGRRLHKEATPRWGGAAFFIGVLPFLCRENGDGSLTAYLVAAALLIVTGMVDDRRSLGWKPKISIMAVAAALVIYSGDITVHQIGFYGSIGSVELGMFSIPFTFLSIIGITNAINLLDGLNGLAGGVSLLGFLFMGIAALLAGNIPVAVICFTFVGALGAFLLYNFPAARIFMGDSGSLFLGFSLAVTALLLTQGPTSSVDSMFPALVLLLPIFDTLRVLLVRLLKGKNPFKADTLHLHYLLVQQNISPVIVTLLFWLGTAIFGGIALALTESTSLPYLVALLSACLFLGLMADGLMKGRAPRSREWSGAPVQGELPAATAGYTRYDTVTPGFARKRKMMTFTGMIVVGIVLMAVQALAGEIRPASPDTDAECSRPSVAGIRCPMQERVQIPDGNSALHRTGWYRPQGNTEVKNRRKLILSKQLIRYADTI